MNIKTCETFAGKLPAQTATVCKKAEKTVQKSSSSKKRVTDRLRTFFAFLLCTAVMLLYGCGAATVGTTDTVTETDSPASCTEETGINGSPETAPVFSASGGLYGEGFELSLSVPESSPEGAYIAYTVNGDEPGPDSEKYGGAIVVAKTKTVRAAMFSSDDKMIGRIVTNTYVINEPSALRTVALSVDGDDLYSADRGILSNRAGSGAEWERPVSVEIYEPDGTALIRQDAGVRLAGSGSRSFDPASLRVIARSYEKSGADGEKYSGGGKFRADLFGDGFTEYDRFLLRNGGNDSPYQAREKFLRMNLLRDCISNEYCHGLGERLGISVFAQRCVPVRVYMNGEYYGISIMKEDFDERLISERYGLDKNSVTVIKGKKLYYQLESGGDAELDEWLSLCGYAADNALSENFGEAYEYVSGRIDVDNAAAYLSVMLYLCNTDWPQNNAMVWRYTGERTDGAFSDGKWRFVIRDMDLCFALHDAPSRVSNTTYTMADTDTFFRLLVFYREGKGYDYDQSLGFYGDDMKLQGLFDFLLRSADFRRKFEKICDTLCTAEEAEHMKNTAKAVQTLCRTEIKRHIDVWKTAGKIYGAYSYSNWERSFEDMEEFISDRPAYFRKYQSDTMKYYEN